MVRISVSFVVLASFLSTALAVLNAFFLKQQFYPSVVYLTKSSTSMAVLYFQAAVISYLVFSLVRWVFFGQLRAAEVEHAQERVWHAIMETCLAFTVFRDDFSPKFVIQFVILFFVKAFHWLAEERVDYMERSPLITVLFHARILGIVSLLSAIDSYFISHAFFTTLMRGASAQIVFGFEYAVLMTVIAHITINYILHLHDIRSPHPWENKAVYMLYAELFTSFLRCVLYLLFAIVMMKIHTFPLFAIRPFYLTVRAFRKAVNDVILSRRAINAMNNLFPLATAQDLAENDNTCIICREEMTVQSGAKKLPCNHIFHPNCLRSWFQRQQTCPTCRTDVLVHRHPATVFPGGQQPPAQMAQQAGAQFAGFAGFPFIQHPVQFQLRFAAPPAAGQAQAQQPQQQNIQQQPQGGQPPAAFLAGMPFPMMPFGGMHPAMMAQPPQQPPPQQQAQQQTQDQNQQQPAQMNGGTGPGRDANAGGAQQQQTDGQQPQQQQNPMPPQPPPFPFFSPFMFPPQFGGGFMLPPPPPMLPFPPRPTLSGMNEAEVAAMEGTERRAVEARVDALRNISVLLDAALMQFQQYLTAAGQSARAGTDGGPRGGGGNGPTEGGQDGGQSTSGTSSDNNANNTAAAQMGSEEERANDDGRTGGDGVGQVNDSSSKNSSGQHQPQQQAAS